MGDVVTCGLIIIMWAVVNLIMILGPTVAILYVVYRIVRALLSSNKPPAGREDPEASPTIVEDGAPAGATGGLRFQRENTLVALVAYIEGSRRAGMPDGRIVEDMRIAGWTEAEIREAVAVADTAL